MKRAVTHTGSTARRAEDPGPSEVLEGFLYVGSAEHALSEPILRELGVTHVLNAAAREVNALADDRSRLPLQLRDDMDESIAAVFPKAIDFIDTAEEASGRCLVHCMAGRSRSVSLCLAYLMARRGMSLLEAWQKVEICRPEADPNPGFWQQLQMYEESVRGSRSDLPAKVKKRMSICAAGPPTPESVYSQYFTAALNDDKEQRKVSLTAWDVGWREEAVGKVVAASFAKTQPTARTVAVAMLEHLCRTEQLAREEAARGIAAIVDDEELAAEERLDIPQYDEFRATIVDAARAVGLLQKPEATALVTPDRALDRASTLDRACTAPPP